MKDQIRGDDAGQHAPEPSGTPPKSKSRTPRPARDNDGHLLDEQGRKMPVPVEDLNTSNDEGAGWSNVRFSGLAREASPVSAILLEKSVEHVPKTSKDSSNFFKTSASPQ